MRKSDDRDFPVLSIVIPSYNQGQYLEKAILSVLAQNDPQLRLAVVDGGSTDNSVEIIRKYEACIAFWCSEPDGGQSAAIVKGFEEIGGDLRGWLNSDDEYVRGTFSRIRRAFTTHPHLGLVYGNRILIDQSSAVVGWSREPAYDPTVSGYSIASETAFWTIEGERQAGPIDPALNFAMDLDFFTRLFLTVDSKKLNSYLGRFRGHEESKTATIPEQGKNETARLWRQFFGDSQTWKVPARRRSFGLIAAGIRHPLLLAVPYVRFKLTQRSSWKLKF